MPPSCALLSGFAIGARVALLWQHNAKPSYYKLASTPRYDGIVRTRNVSEYMLVLALCLVTLVSNGTSLQQTTKSGGDVGRVHTRPASRSIRSTRPRAGWDSWGEAANPVQAPPHHLHTNLGSAVNSQEESRIDFYAIRLGNGH